ncbi:hypothetical protein GASC598I20_000390, partial [Gilliamella apicola SCGC AB-598-I20]
KTDARQELFHLYIDELFLDELESLELPVLLERRFQRLMNYGYVR